MTSSAHQLSKEPFEKVRSLVERRKLFEYLVRKQEEIICKSEDEGDLFTLKPQKIENDQVLCQIHQIPSQWKRLLPSAKHSLKIMANFNAEPDRYFMYAPIEVYDSTAFLNINSDVYKLQRRQSFRIQIPQSVPIYINITEMQGRKAFLDAKLFDLSAGGARIYFPGQDVPVVTGLTLKGVLHPPSGKTIEFQATVKHLLAAVINGAMTQQFGIEFLSSDPVFKSRMTSLTMDLQHKIIVGL